MMRLEAKSMEITRFLRRTADHGQRVREQVVVSNVNVYFVTHGICLHAALQGTNKPLTSRLFGILSNQHDSPFALRRCKGRLLTCRDRKGVQMPT